MFLNEKGIYDYNLNVKYVQSIPVGSLILVRKGKGKRSELHLAKLLNNSIYSSPYDSSPYEIKVEFLDGNYWGWAKMSRIMKLPKQFLLD